jgi:hypothetical protein
VQRRRRRAADPAAHCNEPAHTTGRDSDAGCYRFALADAAWCDAHADAAGNDTHAVAGPNADARGQHAFADAPRSDTDADFNADTGPHAQRQAHRDAIAGRDPEPHSLRRDAVADADTDGNTGADRDAHTGTDADADVFTGRI